MNVLHIVGPPGSGKSTLVEALTAGLDVAEVRWQETPLYLLRYLPGSVIELGRLATEEKPRRGSDRLTMNVIEYAWPFARYVQPEMILIEGARLEARSWIAGLEGLGYDYHVVHLHAPKELRAERLAEREAQQDEKWAAARETQTERFYREARHATQLDAALAPAVLARELAMADPVAEALLGATIIADLCRSEPRAKPEAAVQDDLQVGLPL